MAATNYGGLTAAQIKTLANQLHDGSIQTAGRWPLPVGKRPAAVQPYPPGWELGAIKRKGRPTLWLLWIDNVQMGPFNTLAARRRFIKTTLELQNAEP